MKSHLSKFIPIVAALGLVAQSDNACAGETYYGKTSAEVFDDVSLFRANEFSVDLFGTFVDVNSSLLDSDWGGGVGVNYFVTKHLGFGTDILFWNGDGNVTSLSGSIILRAPIETGGSIGVAPYLMGGVGGTFDAPIEEVFGHVGGGIELRFTEHFGIFGDARYIWEYDTDDMITLRTGVRFAF